MDLLTVAFVGAGVSGVLGAAGYCIRMTRIWRRFSGGRVVTCPETGRPAAVRIDVAHAVMTDIREPQADLRLAECSRWPTRGPCDETCRFEAQDPESKVATIVGQWYEGKTCVYCHHLLGEDPIAGHHAAFLGTDGITREWSEVAPERLSETLRAAWPVCWNCHVAETFRRHYPQLVTDRTNANRIT